MPFVNRSILFSKFMRQLRQRIEKNDNPYAITFFEFFLERQLPEEVRRRVAHDWDGQVNAGDFDVIYPMAASILHDAATREASETHSETYIAATAVSLTICAELNELFQCSGEEAFDPLPIRSYSEIMAEAGLVDLALGSDGQTMVSLSEKGQRVAHEVEEEIHKGRGLN